MSGEIPAGRRQDASALPRALTFTGAVTCQPCGGGHWRLRGRLLRGDADDSHAVVELLLTDVRPQPPAQRLPSRLHELLITASERAAQTLEFASREGCFVLEVGTLTLHRDVAAAFFRVVPGTSPPPSARLGWALLLTLLRLPPVARLASRAGKQK